MTPEQRLKAFLREQTHQMNQWNAQRKASAKDVERILNKAQGQVNEILRNQPTEWQSYHMKQLSRSLEMAMEETASALKDVAVFHQDKAIALGQAALDAPLAGAGFSINALSPTVNTSQLAAMRNFMTDRMEAIAARAVQRINDQMGLVMAGSQTSANAATSIANLLGGDRGRALTIMRTEIGRAYATATQERMTEASVYLPALQKEWRKSGKARGRIEHIAADGQIRNVDEPFDVGGEKLMYPRDPNGSIGNTINCGCESVAWMAAWDI